MKGVNFLIAVVVITIILSASIWVYMIGSVILDSMIPELKGVADELNNTNVDTVIVQTETSWHYGIYVVIVGLIIILVVLSQRTEYSQERSYGY